MQFDLSRWKHFTAMAIIGDGVMGIINPRRQGLALRPRAVAEPDAVARRQAKPYEGDLSSAGGWRHPLGVALQQGRRQGEHPHEDRRFTPPRLTLHKSGAPSSR